MLASLRTADDEALGIDARLIRRLLAGFDEPASATVVRAPSQGTFHRLYEVRDHAARLLRVAATAGEYAAMLMALECELMTSLRERGLPVPQCEYRRDGEGEACRGAHRIARVEGTSLTDFDDDEPRMVQALQEVARFLAKLHRIPGAGFGPIAYGRWPALAGVHAAWDEYLRVRLAEHVRACEARGAISADEAGRIARLFEEAGALFREQRPSLLHGDPGSHNFIVREGRIHAVVDWEDALIGDALFDLASLCTFHPERRHAAIRSAYGAAIEPGSDAWRRFWLYFLRIALAKTVHRHRFGYADRPGRAPASQRIQLALARLAEAQ